VVFAAAAVVEVVFGLPVHARVVPRRRLLPRLRRAGRKICLDTLLQETSRTTSAAGSSPSTTRCSTSASCRPPPSAVLLPPDGKSYLVIAIIAGGYAVTALVYGVVTRAARASEPPEPVGQQGW
jgi:hypothetical protein